MKKNSFLFIFTFLLIQTNFIYAKDIKSTAKIKPEIKSIVIIKPEIRYDENIKYEKIDEYKIPETVEKKKYDFGFDLDINKEERTINYWKVDIKTNF
jgi:hypothetical protein